MFEDITYDSLMERILNKVPANIDKREGSVIYNAVAPLTFEILRLLEEIGIYYEETFADTASYAYLTKIVAERGLTPKDATKSLLKAKIKPASINVVGNTFIAQGVGFTVTSQENGILILECNESGSIGNINVNTLVPEISIWGLEEVKILEILSPARDYESIEDLRKRYRETFELKAFGGNIRDYREYVEDISGVAGCKVLPAGEGAGTVVLYIMGDTTVAFLDKIKKILTGDDSDGGAGKGVAPIGHKIYVYAAEESVLRISLKCEFDAGVTWAMKKAEIENVIEEYFAELSKSWSAEEQTIARVAQIESRVLTLADVKDVTVKINGIAANKKLLFKQYPKLGVVTNG